MGPERNREGWKAAAGFLRLTQEEKGKVLDVMSNEAKEKSL